MVYIDIAIIIYINNIAFGILPATRLLFESHVGSGANVGGMTPGMAKFSRSRPRSTLRIKKIRYDVKDMKKRRKQKNRTLGRLPAPAACSGCARAGFPLAGWAFSPAAASLACSLSRPGGPTSGFRGPFGCGLPGPFWLPVAQCGSALVRFAWPLPGPACGGMPSCSACARSIGRLPPASRPPNRGQVHVHVHGWLHALSWPAPIPAGYHPASPLRA
jgi:hypothetical protein